MGKYGARMMDVAAFVLWLFTVVRSIVFRPLANKLLTARVDFYKLLAGHKMQMFYGDNFLFFFSFWKFIFICYLLGNCICDNVGIFIKIHKSNCYPFTIELSRASREEFKFLISKLNRVS